MGAPIFEVRITQDAEHDLEGIYNFIASEQSLASADKFFDALSVKVSSLETFPLRGAFPSELSVFGIDEFRQILFGTYRIVYSVVEGIVYVHIIADARRDMQALLERRLLTAKT